MGSVSTEKRHYPNEKIDMSKVEKNSNQERLDGMVLPKYLSNQFASGLLNALEDEPFLRTFCTKAYRNTYYCNWSIPYDADKDKLKQTTLCKNRWCQYCQRFKTAHYMNAYGTQLEQLPTKYFLTLTAPTVPANDLKQRIKDFEGHWRKIMDLVRKYTRKDRLEKPMGIRKMECTLRPNDHYHYHYHILIDNKEVGQFILLQWLKRFSTATRKAQDLREADDGSIHELFKYFTKLSIPLDYLKANLTEKEHKKCNTKMTTFSYYKKKSKCNYGYYNAYFRRMHFLFSTLYRKRVFQPFGKMKMIDEELETEPLRRPHSHISERYEWNPYIFHWQGRERITEQLSYIDVELAAQKVVEMQEQKAALRKEK